MQDISLSRILEKHPSADEVEARNGSGGNQGAGNESSLAPTLEDAPNLPRIPDSKGGTIGIFEACARAGYWGPL